jgi:phytoene synthase
LVAQWEHQLLDWANEGLGSHPAPAQAPLDGAALERAYHACADVTRRHSRTFTLASGLLPRVKCRAVRALYAFCRTTDDIVDQKGSGSADPLAQLQEWRERALSDHAEARDPVALAWIDTRSTFEIPQRYAEQLIAGVARDLTQARYVTFEDLTIYCYGVASTVGLMAMHIVGFDSPEALAYAVRLGIALQLTNILRDVGEDWRSGRLYLPLSELAEFGLTEADVAVGCVDERWRRFMRFQIDRVRHLYADALPGIGMLHRDGRLAIGAAAELYRGILEEIEAHDMDVFHQRASLSTRAKLGRLPGIWWRANVVGYNQNTGES